MKLIFSRRAGVTVVAAALVASSIAFAGPAGAFPAHSWWYGELGISQAQKVTTGTGITVAVLDSGVQATLPDLRGQVLAGKVFAGGGDATTDRANSTATYFGHGTAMAAYIAGTGKGAGMVGVAPGAKILPVRIGPDGEHADSAATAKAIPWAVDHGAKIINISSGSPTDCQPFMQQAVDYALRRDVIVVAAVGNTPGVMVDTPANCIGVIAVGALADTSAFRAWSGQSTGPKLDFVTPGQNLRALLLSNQLSNPDSSGTSDSSALASGVFALLRAKFPTESARQIVTRAMWNVHNGLGGKIFAKRINDSLGYGAILANYALTQNPPANATNPLYDEVDAHLKSTTPSAGASSTAAAGASTAPRASSQDSGGVSVGLVVAVVMVLVLLVVALVFGFTRSRRRPARAGGVVPPGGHGPPPGGYGPPPGGYGPG